MPRVTREDTIAKLRRALMFRDLDDAQLEPLAARAVTDRFEPGQMIMGRGDNAEAMIVVTSGHVRITTSSDLGAELTIDVLGPGGIFGELALISGAKRRTDAVASEEVEVVRLSRSAFVKFLEANPHVSFRVIELLCEKLRRMIDLVEEATFLDLPARLYQRLMVLAELYGEKAGHGVLINHRMPQKDLASSIGAARESINKQLHAWTQLGLVESGAGYVRIKDIKALAREVGV